MKKIFLLILLSIFVLSGCQQNIHDDKIEIVTTIYPLAEFAKSVGSDKVKVSMLLPPGADAHNYDPKPSDIIKVNNADFFIYIGKEMEPWANQILNSVDDVIIIETINYVYNIIEDDHYHEHGHSHEHHGHDEHTDKHHEHDEHTDKHHEHDEHSHEHKEDIIHKIDHIIHEWEDNEISADKAMHEIEHLIHDYLKHDHKEHEHEHEEHTHNHNGHSHDHHDHGHDSHSQDHHEHSHEYDPHIWLDFDNNIEIVNAIANYISDLDKENEEFYKNNALIYNNRLNNLHNEFKDSLENCNKRKI
ncbi:MAG: metal ABC transporter substrate-binding protein, partial [Candidatus Woesearchaeota archaeon]